MRFLEFRLHAVPKESAGFGKCDAHCERREPERGRHVVRALSAHITSPHEIARFWHEAFDALAQRRQFHFEDTAVGCIVRQRQERRFVQCIRAFRPPEMFQHLEPRYAASPCDEVTSRHEAVRFARDGKEGLLKDVVRLSKRGAQRKHERANRPFVSDKKKLHLLGRRGGKWGGVVGHF